MKNAYTECGDYVAVHLGVRGLPCTALIDPQDLSVVAAYPGRWSPHRVGKTIYARGCARHGQPIVYMHRLILPDVALIDHVDHNGLNNRRSNLVPSNKSLNGLNRNSFNTNNRQKVRGVVQSRRRTIPFLARVSVQGVPFKLGWFATPEEAGAAVQSFLRERQWLK